MVYMCELSVWLILHVKNSWFIHITGLSIKLWIRTLSLARILLSSSVSFNILPACFSLRLLTKHVLSKLSISFSFSPSLPHPFPPFLPFFFLVLGPFKIQTKATDTHTYEILYFSELSDPYKSIRWQRWVNLKIRTPLLKWQRRSAQSLALQNQSCIQI